MTDAVRIDYQLGKNGWSHFQLNVGTDSVVVGPFGYCTDAPGDLVRSALVIATSGLRAEVSFDAEPIFRTRVRQVGGPARTRTSNLRIRNAMLYPLSYGTMPSLVARLRP